MIIPGLRGEETEAERGSITCLRSESEEVGRPPWSPGTPAADSVLNLCVTLA